MSHAFAKIFTLVFFMTFYPAGFSQETNFKPEGSFSIDLGIPANGKNPSFGRVMEGLFNGGVGYQYNIFGGLTIGGGLKYSYFIINSFAISNADWGGGLHMPAASFKIAYERFTTDRISLNASIRLGYAYIISSNDSCRQVIGKPHTVSAFFMEPQLEIVLLTAKTSPDGFSLVIGYPMYFTDFGPAYLCMNSFPALIDEDYVGITRFLSIGFGYRYYLGRK